MLDEILEELRSMRLCDSSNRFSLDWLDMNESYWRTIRAKKWQHAVMDLKLKRKELEAEGDKTVKAMADRARQKQQKFKL